MVVLEKIKKTHSSANAIFSSFSWFRTPAISFYILFTFIDSNASRASNNKQIRIAQKIYNISTILLLYPCTHFKSNSLARAPLALYSPIILINSRIVSWDP